MTNRINIGNTKISGFVNHVAAGRFVLGTGSFTPRGSTDKVFKESVTVFLDEAFDGNVPEKNDYVVVSGDLSVQPRRDKPDELNATMNVRFKSQVLAKDPPTRA